MAVTRAIMGPELVAAPSDERGGSTSADPGPATPHANRLLACLPPSDLALLAPHLQVMSVRAGTVLQRQGHPVEHVCFPHEGLVLLQATTADGGMIQAASVGRAGAVCPVLKFDVREAFLDAVALSAMRISRISLGKIDGAQREHETIDRIFRACGRALLLQLRQNVICNGHHSGEQRVARWIVETADRLESDILPIPVTQAYVAQCLGIRRTTVTLVVRALQDVEAIRWGRSRVEILNRALIEARACTCYAALRDQMRLTLPDERSGAA